MGAKKKSARQAEELSEREILRRARQDAGLSQAALAELLDVTTQWISAIERGTSRIGHADISRLRDVLPDAHAQISLSRLERYRSEMGVGAAYMDEVSALTKSLGTQRVRNRLRRIYDDLAGVLEVIEPTQAGDP